MLLGGVKLIRAVRRAHPSGNRPGCRARSARFTAALALAHGELAEEVFVDAPEGVVVQRGGDLGDAFEQFLKQGAGEEVVALGQDAGELRVVLLDVAHGGIDLRADVLGFGAVEQVIEPRLGRQI